MHDQLIHRLPFQLDKQPPNLLCMYQIPNDDFEVTARSHRTFIFLHVKSFAERTTSKHVPSADFYRMMTSPSIHSSQLQIDHRCPT